MSFRTIIILFIAVLLSTICVDAIMGKSYVAKKRAQTKKECKQILKENSLKTKQLTFNY